MFGQHTLCSKMSSFSSNFIGRAKRGHFYTQPIFRGKKIKVTGTTTTTTTLLAFFSCTCAQEPSEKFLQGLLQWNSGMERKKGTSQFPRSWLSLETAATLSIFWTRWNNLIASSFHLASGNHFLRCCCQSPNSSILYALDPTTPTTFASLPNALERSPHRLQQTWFIILVPFFYYKVGTTEFNINSQDAIGHTHKKKPAIECRFQFWNYIF